MLAFLAKLIPFRDYAYAGIAIGVAIFWWHHDRVEQAEGATRVTVAVAAATAKANASAQALVDQYTNAYAASALAIKDSYEQRIEANATAHDADLQRLRHLAASSNSNAGQVLHSATGSQTSTDSGTGSSDDLGTVPAKFALELADALRSDDAALAACYADRDSLTGK